MSAPSENPFASPALISSTGVDTFFVSDKEIAAREIVQAWVAGGLTLLFSLLWVAMQLTAPPAPLVVHLVWLFFVASCLATTLNHRARAQRAWQRLPLLLDETRLSAKFQDGDEWIQRELRWSEITGVHLERNGKMVVRTIGGLQHFADCRPIGFKRLKQLEKCLQRYSDDMAPEDAN